MNTRRDIIVVGGGVVGAALTLALSQKGFDVALIERGPVPRGYEPEGYDPRVFALAPRSIAFLQQLAVWPAVAAQRVSSYLTMRVWDESAARALRFDAAEAGASELGSIVEQGLLLDRLWQALPADRIVTGASVEQIEFEEDGATLRMVDGTKWSAALVVSAEGGDSVLRERAGIQTIGWGYAQRAIVCHVRTEQAHRRQALQRFLPSGPLAFLPLADGRCSIVWSVRESEAESLLALSEPEFNTRLAAALQFELGAVLESTPRQSFPLRLLHARSYVRPGFALVGDSAHVIHPLAGQGVNLGLADAETLVGIVEQARASANHWSGLRTLKRYERSRLAANLEMMAVTDGLYRAFRLDFPGWATLLSRGLSTVSRIGPVKDQLLRRALAA